MPPNQIKRSSSVPMVAILGFGFNPSEENLSLASAAAARLANEGYGIAVGNLVGTFAVAIETAAVNLGPTLAVVDSSLADQPYPESTQLLVVEAAEKHSTIARIASGGLILGGAGGTLKLSGHMVQENKPLAAVRGTGGVVDDGSLDDLVKYFDVLGDAIDYLQSTLALPQENIDVQ